MIYNLENEFLQLGINNIGAELTFINSTKTSKKFLWEGDPKFWGNHAPVLFPIVGGLKQNTYYYKGNMYNLPRHGFIRNNDKIKVLSQDEQQITFQLKSDQESLLVYPFEFDFQIQFKLIGNKIYIEHQIINLNQGEMLFSIGAHPAFSCPVDAETKYEDYYFEFEFTENEPTYLLTTDGLVSNSTEPTLENTNKLQLSNTLFDRDALIFKTLKSRKIALKSKNSTSVIEVNFSDFPFLGLWAKPNAPFVCIEPWLGIADHENTDMQLQNKEGIIVLQPKEIFKATYSIVISE